ncbi:hypothetical protein ACFV3E_24475 [Streptomyces sp. NPDC059718]
MAAVTRRYDSIQYSGTNGAFIAGTWNTTIRLVSDDGQTLVYIDGDEIEKTVTAGQWLVQDAPTTAYPWVLTPEQYSDQWRPISDTPQ